MLELRFGRRLAGNHQLHGSLLEMFTIGPVYRVSQIPSATLGQKLCGDRVTHYGAANAYERGSEERREVALQWRAVER
jgi:hypothetical protein